VTAADGEEAWGYLQAEAEPEVALLAWIMPGPDCIEICRRVRTNNRRTSAYIIIVTLKPILTTCVLRSGRMLMTSYQSRSALQTFVSASGRAAVSWHCSNLVP
jgi:CheY-like chemotaxis protein